MPAMQPVVVGYDGTAESRDALELARLLATALDAPVVAVSVLTAAPLEIDWRAFLSDLDEQGRRLAAEAREGLAGVSGLETVTVPAPSPPRELDRLATERDACVVVLGSTRRGMLGRVLPGTVADRLVAGAPCPVAVAPRGFSSRDARLQSIGVGLDGGAESRNAVLEATRIAAVTGGRLTLVCVFDPCDPVQATEVALGYPGLATPPGTTRERVDGLWTMARNVVRELSIEVPVAIEVVEGQPAAVLGELSDRFDLLVLGSRGHGPFGRVLAGSVSSAVLRGSSCPVLVAPRPDNPSDAVAPGADQGARRD